MTVATPSVVWIGVVLPARLVDFGRRDSASKTMAVEGWFRLGEMGLQAVGLTPPRTFAGGRAAPALDGAMRSNAR